MYLYGKDQIIERIKTNPKSIRMIYYRKNSDIDFLKSSACRRNIRCRLLSARDFLLIAKHNHTQDVVAEIDAFFYAQLTDLLNLSDAEKYSLIALSNITDPQNLGLILRSAACFGGFAVVIPKHRAASVNKTVLKVACGGENYVPVIQVTNLIPVLQQAKQAGYWITGSVVDGGENLNDFRFSFPLCLVIGAEDKGIRKGIMPHLDYRVSMPMRGEKLSFNAAVAASIFCYEIMCQKKSRL